MNKKTGLIIGAVIGALLIGGSAWWFFSQPKDNNQTQPAGQNTSFAQPKDACAYLTDAIALKVLGAGAEKSPQTPAATSDDLSVSTCMYTSKSGNTVADVKNMRTAILLVRSPLSLTGAQSNEEPFDAVKSGAVGVSGYGEEAYWDPELGQLNVLKGGMWLIMSVGKSEPANHSIDETKALADLILPQF